MKDKYVGIVEGFFSNPLPVWTFKERSALLRFIYKNASNINTYFYCPKDDLFVTKNWDQFYPPNNILELREFIKLCEELKINFVYGFNPSLDSSSNLELTNKIISKINQLINLGCKNFCLLFDDILMAYDVTDNNLDNLRASATLIKKIVNEVYSKVRKNTEEFWFCGPDYCYNKPSILNSVLNDININVPFIWSGKNVFVRNINEDDLKKVKSVLGKDRKIIYWSNYPVNDCEQSVESFNMGGFNNPEESVNEGLYAILANPMREPYANLPFFITFSDYVNNPSGYRRKESWNKAIKKIIGKESDNYIKLFKEFTQRNLIDYNKKYIYSSSLNVSKLPIPKKQYGKVFLKSIKPIIQDANWYLKVIQKIDNKEKINYRNFVKNDRFPTNLSVSRYYPEIFKIIRARMFFVQNKDVTNKYLKPFKEIFKLFLTKYKGSKKLNITTSDNKLIIKSIRSLLQKERRIFVNYLNNPKVAVSSKTKTFQERQNTNRFFV